MNPHAAKKLEEAASYAPQSGPLHASNQGFHGTYNRLVDRTMAELGATIPVIVMIGDDLFLLNDGIERSGRVLPDLYHQLKSFGHISFGVQLSLMACGEDPIDEATSEELAQKLIQIRDSRELVDHLPADVRLAITTLLDLSTDVVERARSDRKVDPSLLDRYSSDICPLVLEVSGVAVRLEIDLLHALVTTWHQHLDNEAWNSLHVVICDTHQPRYRHAARQYFGRLLREREGIAAQYEDRIVFAEGIQSIDAACDLLARHLIDQKASLMIFGDKSRLQKDLVGDAASNYLDQIFPGSR